MHIKTIDRYSLLFGDNPTELRVGDFAKIDTKAGTIALIRGAERIYVSSLLNKKDDKIYIGALDGRDPATVVMEVTGFNVSKKSNGDDCVIFELISKNDE